MELFDKYHPIGQLGANLSSRRRKIVNKLFALSFGSSAKILKESKELAKKLPRMSSKIINTRAAHRILASQAQSVKILLKLLNGDKEGISKLGIDVRDLEID